MKMSKVDFELRHASIMEQWEAKRLVDQEAADNWRLDELTKLYESSGWTLDEISDWFAGFMARRLSSSLLR